MGRPRQQDYDPDEEDETKSDSAERIQSVFDTSGRPPPDVFRRDDDELIMMRMPDGSMRFTARDDPFGFKFTKFNTARIVNRILKPNNTRQPRRKPKL